MYILVYENLFNIFRLLVILSFIFLSPLLLVSLAVSILQAATQIQDQVFSYFLKLLTFILLLFFLSPWVLEQLKISFEQGFNSIIQSKRYIAGN